MLEMQAKKDDQWNKKWISQIAWIVVHMLHCYVFAFFDCWAGSNLLNYSVNLYSCDNKIKLDNITFTYFKLNTIKEHTHLVAVVQL